MRDGHAYVVFRGSARVENLSVGAPDRAGRTDEVATAEVLGPFLAEEEGLPVWDGSGWQLVTWP